MTPDYLRTLERQSETFTHALDRHSLLGNVINGEASPQEYVQFLSATYHYVRWSGFLLAKTAQGLSRTGRCSSLLELVAAKAEEEAPHDRWVLRDLQSCGQNAELVKGSSVPTAVRAYVGWSSSVAESGSPAFLGAAYTLEYISMRRAKLSAHNLRARGAIPNIDRALRFLDGHGEADQGHIAELEAALGALEDPRDQAEVTLSAAVLRRLYPDFFATPSSHSNSDIRAERPASLGCFGTSGRDNLEQIAGGPQP